MEEQTELVDVNKNNKTLGYYPVGTDYVVIWINDDRGGNRVQVQVRKKDFREFIELSEIDKYQEKND